MTTTTKVQDENLYYTTHKHAFEGLPNDSVTCRYCKRSFTDKLHCNVSDRDFKTGGD